MGLRLAGIDVVSSYERWGPANETNFKNNNHQAQTIDIRRLSFDDLPKNIDIVVGSPPCTQFSFSNRGGSGDVDDGLVDIIKFLSIVEHLRPKFWAMENVPRVAKIIEYELGPKGRLHKFAHLGIELSIVNMEKFGLPQRRKRCIAGNLNFELLDSYSRSTKPRTLGNVIRALAAKSVVDPIFGVNLPKSRLFDHVLEDPLNEEEARTNRANKAVHPVYNSMPFPDPLNKSVRTITATCTRVSRESVVIPVGRSKTKLRRLTIRERASLQGFPITFQFYGTNYSQKLRMIGNAIPPLFSYYLAHAILGTTSDQLPSLADHSVGLESPTPEPLETPPDSAGAKYPSNRRFRFAIPSLRLKSGVRFQLANLFGKGTSEWEVAFYFGTSKAIHSLKMDGRIFDQLSNLVGKELTETALHPINELVRYLEAADIKRMQKLWSHRGLGQTRPFMILDKLDSVGSALCEELYRHPVTCWKLVKTVIYDEYGQNAEDLPGLNKLEKNAPLILAGLLIGSAANREFEIHAMADTNIEMALIAS